MSTKIKVKQPTFIFVRIGSLGVLGGAILACMEWENCGSLSLDSELSVWDLVGWKNDDMEGDNRRSVSLDAEPTDDWDLLGGKIDDMEGDNRRSVSLDAEPTDDGDLLGGKIDDMEWLLACGILFPLIIGLPGSDLVGGGIVSIKEFLNVFQFLWKKNRALKLIVNDNKSLMSL